MATTNGERRYAAWKGNPQGVPEDKAKCVEEVVNADWIMRQCNRKRGHGPNGEYCKQHAKAHAFNAEAKRYYG